jgi:hypothetical protein
MKNHKTSMASVLLVSFLLTSCIETKIHPLKRNYVTNKSTSVSEHIGDDKIKLHVITQDELHLGKLNGSIIDTNSERSKILLQKLIQKTRNAQSYEYKRIDQPQRNENSLILGFPIGLIGEQNIFGGVITKVSDLKKDNLGMLKLTALEPIHSKTFLVIENELLYFVIKGCVNYCDEESVQNIIMVIPTKGMSAKGDLLYLDMAHVGKNLNLMKILKQEGSATKLVTVSNEATTMDFSGSTLVFDIVSTMIPEGSVDVKKAPKTDITVRWYLKLNSVFNPAFIPRNPTQGVGFFLTKRNTEPKITRLSTTNYDNRVKYYIKNVPDQYKQSFSKAFDNWNSELKKVIGHELLAYEFLDAKDEESALIVTGDIRYNVIEWDLNNLAPYSALGPSSANQYTGEIFSANILVQGPTIIDFISKWFSVSNNAKKLESQGKTTEANKIMAKFNSSYLNEMLSRNKTTFSFKFNSIDMTIYSQEDELEDQMNKGHFDILETKLTLEEYLENYLTETLEHELGHNLGLRHNFKGNLGGNDSKEKGSVSRSVMEYLSPNYSYLNTIGQYDLMAISYAYKGIKPQHLDWYCSDDDLPKNFLSLALKSPECNKSDSTNDPYSFWASRISRAVDLVIEANSQSAPVWKVDEVIYEVTDAVIWLTSYAASAEITANEWTNFFDKEGRPQREDMDGIKEYVKNTIKEMICDPKISKIISEKDSAEGKIIAENNYIKLKIFIGELSKKIGVLDFEELKCE